MGVTRGLVFSLDRRGLLAVLAIAISVGYALVAGAAVTGLQEAQETLGADVQDTSFVVVHPEGASFAPDAVGGEPVVALATLREGPWTVYAVRVGTPLAVGPGEVQAGPATGLAPGDTVELGGDELTVVRGELPPGALPGWLGVAPANLVGLGAADDGRVTLAVHDELTDAQRERAQGARLAIHEAPAALPFYEAGADQLVSTVQVTVIGSAVVVTLLAYGFISMELEARASSFATLRLFAGRAMVRRVLVARALLLLVAGHALALGVVVLLLAGLARADAVHLTLPTAQALGTLAATFVGGLAGVAVPLARAGHRLRAVELGDRIAPRGPRALRLTVASYRSVLPLTLAALVLAASLGVVFGTFDLPNQLFGATNPDDGVIATTQGNPLRGTVPAFTGEHLARVDRFEAASPEVFAPTLIDGRPVLVRGADWDRLVAMDDLRLERGGPPVVPGAAVVGTRLAEQLGVGPGDRLVVPAPYHAAVVRVQLVGVFEGGGILDDELVTSLPTARALAGLDPDRVNIVRFRAAPDAERPTAGPPRTPSGIEVVGLGLEPRAPVPLEPADAVLDVINFSPGPATRQVTLRVNDRPVADAWISMDGHEIGQRTVRFTTPRVDRLVLEVNPSAESSVVEPAYRIEAPDEVAPRLSFDVRVTTPDGQPARGVTLRAADAEARTDAAGHATMAVARVGNHTLVASGPAGRAAEPLLVVDPGARDRPVIVVRSVSGPQRIETTRWSGTVEVENLGGVAFDGVLPLLVDGEAVNTSEILLAPGQLARVQVAVQLQPGEHVIGPPGAALVVVAEAPGTPGAGRQGPSIEELLALRREQVRAGEGASQDATAAFLGDTFENVNAALTVITLATGLHAGLVVALAVHRDLEARAGTVGTLAALGATRSAIRGRALRDFLIVGVPSALVGTALGLWLAHTAAEWGLIAGFGHALVPRSDLGFLLRVAATALATTLGVAAISVDHVRARRLQALLAQGPTRSDRPPLDVLIGEAHP